MSDPLSSLTSTTTKKSATSDFELVLAFFMHFISWASFIISPILFFVIGWKSIVLTLIGLIGYGMLKLQDVL